MRSEVQPAKALVSALRPRWRTKSSRSPRSSTDVAEAPNARIVMYATRRRRAGEQYEFTATSAAEEAPQQPVPACAPGDAAFAAARTPHSHVEAPAVQQTRRVAAVAAHDVSWSSVARGVAFAPPPVAAFVLPRLVPLPDGITPVVDAAVGASHTLLALTSGQVWVQGANDACQLGTGDRQPAVQPRLLSTLGRPVSRVFARGDWSVALATSGDVAVWGHTPLDAADAASSSSSPSWINSRLPRWLAWLPHGGGGTTRVTHLACGTAHMLLHTADGAVYACGDDTWGQLGLGPDAAHDAAHRVSRQSPCRVDRLRGMKVTHLAAGDSHSAAVLADGRVFTWGRASHGRLGHSAAAGGAVTNHEVCSSPCAVAHSAWVTDPAVMKQHARDAHSSTGFARPPVVYGTERVVHVTCGDTHTVAVTHIGAVWTWGFGPAGQLGLGALGVTAPVLLPTRVDALQGVNVSRCTAGDAHTVALTTDGRLFVWGAGSQGQLGTGTPEDVRFPAQLPPSQQVIHPPPVAPHDGGNAHAAASAHAVLEAAKKHPLQGVQIGHFACGRNATLVWTPDGRALYACGAGAFGQPGQRHATSISARTSQPLGDDQAAQAAAAVGLVRLIRPDMVAPALLDNLRAGGPFTAPVMAHILRALMDAVLGTSFNVDFLTTYSRVAHVLSTQFGDDMSPYGFRHAVVDAVEDAAVRVMATSVVALSAAVAPPLGAPRVIAEKSGEDESVLKTAAREARNAANAAVAAREAGRALGAFVRQLATMRVLHAEDVDDLACGCPSSAHSRGMVDSQLMARKLAFFGRMVKPPQRRVEGQPLPPVRLPPLRMSSSEEEAWKQMQRMQQSHHTEDNNKSEAAVHPQPTARLGLPSHVPYPVPPLPYSRAEALVRPLMPPPPVPLGGVNTAGLPPVEAKEMVPTVAQVDAERSIRAVLARFVLTPDVLRSLWSSCLLYFPTPMLEPHELFELLKTPRSPLMEHLLLACGLHAEGADQVRPRLDVREVFLRLLAFDDGNVDDKLALAYDMYDMRQSGFIVAADLRAIARASSLHIGAAIDSSVDALLKAHGRSEADLISADDFWEWAHTILFVDSVNGS